MPYRGVFGQPRPAHLNALALPPASMPPRQGTRPLKAWRYVGVYGPELMLCVGAVRIGPVRQRFWAVLARLGAPLYEQTAIGQGAVRLSPGRVRLLDSSVQL